MEMKSRSTDIHCFKVITLGPANAGKTCLLMKATNRDFMCPLDYNCTIGVDFKIKMCLYKEKTPVKLHIWDTAGQERFFQINRMYYRDVHAVLFIFDLSSHSSFSLIDFYWKDFLEFGSKSDAVWSILVGNKNDCERREVAREEAEAWANAHKIPYVETSAKTGENIESLFSQLLDKVMSSSLSRIISSQKSIQKLRRSASKPKRKFC